jgi:toxin-antitoxin system PIN domain toxin
MLCVDVNVLVDAFRADAPGHAQARAWLEDARRGTEPVAVLPEVASSFVRIVSNRRIWRLPSSMADALAFIAALRSSPAVRWGHAGPRQWELFEGLVSGHALTGDDVPDAYLAAAALDLGATFVTSDRGFTRFRELAVVAPS